ncbi:hypothetical protein GUJ93_ZPchr0014g47381 [Zizania palustris]|uniref:Uncharacterized protein n=1 Tax=Zizania palustris TaxID=103762 RepID=A0A8J5VSL6_ZIZPA|nr:hypothetical protein GUJ93_ZPchr0014g47381 [Zizania palustris]
MVAPTSTLTPPPPPSETTATADPMSSAFEPDAPPEKPKLEEVGFQHSPYYNIRAVVANLRGRFLQVCQGTDTQNKDAALEIAKEIKVIMELSKKMRLDLSAAAGHAAMDARNTSAGEIPSGEKNQVPSTGQTALFMCGTGEKVLLEPVISQIAAKRASVEIKHEVRPIEMPDYTKQTSQHMQGSYVIGGSPIGWNFIMWSGSKPIYYADATQALEHGKVCVLTAASLRRFAPATPPWPDPPLPGDRSAWLSSTAGESAVVSPTPSQQAPTPSPRWGLSSDPAASGGIGIGISPRPCSRTSRPCALRDCATDTAGILAEMGGYEYATNGYHRAMEDGYEDEYSQDEYEEEGSGAGEEYDQEDDEPPEGHQEFLEIRERLKDQIRQKALAASASTAGRSSSSYDRKPPSNFGSFFGPSKPVISQRVIEERKSMKELHNTMPVSRDRRPSGKEIPSSSKVQARPNGLHQKQKIVNEAKRKAEALKDNRDYSFLLSDDADIPSSSVEKPVSRYSLTQKSDRELSAMKSRAPTGQAARVSNGYGLKNKSSTQRYAERKEAGANRERAISPDNGRMHSVVRNGSSQATTSKAAHQKLPSKGPIANRPPMKGANDQSLRTNHQASKQSLSQNGRPPSSQSQKIQSASYGQRPHQHMQSQRPQQSLQSCRPQHSPHNPRSQQSQRPQQSLQRQRQQPSSQIDRLQSSEIQRPQSQSYRPQQSQERRPLSSQGHYSEQRRVQANDRAKPVERQIRHPSKPMPSQPISSSAMRDVHAKKKKLAKPRFNDGSEDEEDPLAMIRSMFRYDPSKYAGRDEDDSDMEADFATIEREEKRSARIARQEDEEQLRLIEEEERREQERKRRKMR